MASDSLSSSGTSPRESDLVASLQAQRKAAVLPSGRFVPAPDVAALPPPPMSPMGTPSDLRAQEKYKEAKGSRPQTLCTPRATPAQQHAPAAAASSAAPAVVGGAPPSTSSTPTSTHVRTEAVQALSSEDAKQRRLSRSPSLAHAAGAGGSPVSVAPGVTFAAGEGEDGTPISSVWVECRESVSGRLLFYHRDTLEIRFDHMPLSTLSTIPKRLAGKGDRRTSTFRRGSTPRKEVDDGSSGAIMHGVDGPGKTGKVVSIGSTTSLPLGSQPLRHRPKRDAEKPVDALVGMDELPWAFDSDDVLVYRARAHRVDHTQSAPPPERLAFPMFFSRLPLGGAVEDGRFFCIVKLPAGSNSIMTHTKIACNADSTDGDSAVRLSLKKVSDPNPESEYILKVVGSEQYVFGTTLLVDFEHVRNCLRNNAVVSLSLLHQPDRDERIAEARTKQLRSFDRHTLLYPPVVRHHSFLRYENPLEACAPLAQQGEFDDWSFIPVHEFEWPFRVRVRGIESLELLRRVRESSTAVVRVKVRVELTIGDRSIPHAPLETSTCTLEFDPVWGTWLSPGILEHRELPRATRICYSVVGVTASGEEVLLGWVNQHLVDERNRVVAGQYGLPLWKAGENANFAQLEASGDWRMRGTSRPCLSDRQPCVLHVEFDQPPLDVVYPPEAESSFEADEKQVGHPMPWDQFRKAERKVLEKLKAQSNDSLRPLSDGDRELIWLGRHSFSDTWDALPMFLRCVDWTNKHHAAEAVRLMNSWTPPDTPEKALELLDYSFQHGQVRAFAIEHLRQLGDSELAEYLLQLVQCLKYEHHHMSPLARFLMDRALSNPYQVGHYFFWHLKAELHDVGYQERWALLLEEYLLHCGPHAAELVAQQDMLDRLVDIADEISTSRNKGVEKAVCKQLLRDHLTQLNSELPEHFAITLNPRWHARSILIDECKYMSSKKVPLWLTFENTDEHGEPHVVMFKSGDDLRQDILTLQVIRAMDRLWLGNDLDLRLKPYNVIATGLNPMGEGVGMIEIVLNSQTISNIHHEFGGARMGALKDDTLQRFIKTHNKGDDATKDAVRNFMHSCAGYCVATFVLGIGDRHSDNIMLSRAGHLFHIDFGHFLGNFKSKAGFNRERSPFVFTPEMAFVMGGKLSGNFKAFKDMSTRALNSVRCQARLLTSLFMLMTSAGMPELQCAQDIQYMRDRLELDTSDKDMAKKFEKEIRHSMGDKYRRLDNSIHMILHHR